MTYDLDNYKIDMGKLFTAYTQLKELNLLGKVPVIFKSKAIENVEFEIKKIREEFSCEKEEYLFITLTLKNDNKYICQAHHKNDEVAFYYTISNSLLDINAEGYFE